MEIGEIFESPAFWILTSIGELTLIFMFIVWKKMGHGDMMPWWAKIGSLILVPIVAAAFSGYAEG